MALYKVVIVEDEERIRSGLLKCVNWKELGFEVVAAFEDGESALDYISENACEVVMTDIMMGKMTGLELIGELKTLDAGIKVIIVSGYSDYAYMKQAIKYKVDDYLLKPVEREELEKIYYSLKNELDHEKKDMQLSDPFMMTLDDLKNVDINGKGNQKPFDQQMIAALNSEDKEWIEFIIKEMIQEFEGITQKEIGERIKKLYYIIAAEFNKRNIDVIQISKGMFNYNELKDKKDLGEIEQYIVDAFMCLCEGLKDVKQDYDLELINSALAYVDQHIMEDLGNEVVANGLSVHPSYLCRVFRKRTGEYLTDYILRIKMREIIKLLKSGEYKVAELAQLMGYASSNYFSTHFKKYTGYSPTEYSARVLKK